MYIKRILFVSKAIQFPSMRHQILWTYILRRYVSTFNISREQIITTHTNGIHLTRFTVLQFIASSATTLAKYGFPVFATKVHADTQHVSMLFGCVLCLVCSIGLSLHSSIINYCIIIYSIHHYHSMLDNIHCNEMRIYRLVYQSDAVNVM